MKLLPFNKKPNSSYDDLAAPYVRHHKKLIVSRKLIYEICYDAIPKSKRSKCKKVLMKGGRHSSMDSILASNPAGPGSNHGSEDFFSDVAVLIYSMH